VGLFLPRNIRDQCEAFPIIPYQSLLNHYPSRSIPYTTMITFDPNLVSHRDFHQILLSGVAPRPIAFVTSRDSEGTVNLAPFSFFNAFASKPPIVAIGPAIAAATGREKDTLLNILETGECTISTVSYPFVEQMNLASTDYPRGVDEFTKSGLSKAESQVVSVPYVAEAQIAMECTLVHNIELFREKGGNGNIMLLRVERLHVQESAMTDGRIDPRKMDLVARMGYSWYARVTPEACFESVQPRVKGIGFDALPERVRHSKILSGNDLALLAGVPAIPAVDSGADTKQAFIDAGGDIDALNTQAASLAATYAMSTEEYVAHSMAQKLLAGRNIAAAWQCVLSIG
jgi:flavin reductase (DIM6/NTAB) family NADH-FMN oxidoreductase RutF